MADFIGIMNRVSGVIDEACPGQLQFAAGMLPFIAAGDERNSQMCTAMFRPEDIDSASPIIVEIRRRGVWHAGERIGLRVLEHAVMRLPQEMHA